MDSYHGFIAIAIFLLGFCSVMISANITEQNIARNIEKCGKIGITLENCVENELGVRFREKQEKENDQQTLKTNKE